jgi:hypothetical protein
MMIHPTRRLVARGSANKLSEPRHRDWELHHRVRQGRQRDSRCFRLVTTVTEEEDDYPEPNVLATYAKATFARIQPTIQKKSSQMDGEPGPTRTRAGQVVTRNHQRLIDLAIDSLQEDDYSGLPDLETDDDDQESVNVIPQFEVQDDGIIEFMHTINIDFSR